MSMNKINYLRLSFKNVGEDGFKDQPLAGFVIAGEDRSFVPAEAKLFFGTVLVWNAAVPKPVAVRYAWPAPAAEGTLRAATDLPTVPFRTDDWPNAPQGQPPQ